MVSEEQKAPELIILTINDEDVHYVRVDTLTTKPARIQVPEQDIQEWVDQWHQDLSDYMLPTRVSNALVRCVNMVPEGKV